MNYETGFNPSLMLDYNYDEGLFTIIYDRKERLTESKVKEILTLINNCYSGSFFKEDWFIQAKKEMGLKEYIDSYYVHKSGFINDIIINIPVYIQGVNGKLYLEWTKHLGLELILNESSEDSFYGITMYPYVYFDFSTLNRKKEKLDQQKAAEKNREILREFLTELENIIGGKPESISSAHSCFKDNIYEYGVRKGAQFLL